MIELVLKRGGKNLMRAAVADKPITIGRSAENIIRLLDPEISRTHCRIESKNGEIYLRDTSRNGTLINGLQKKDAPIKPGDTLTIGPWTIAVENSTEALPMKTIAASPMATKIIACDNVQKNPDAKFVEVFVQTPGQTAIRKKTASAEITIGQHATCGIVVADPCVSRRHCRIINDDGILKLIDLGSTNGTFVEGARIEQASLGGAGSFTIGKTKIACRISKTSKKTDSGKNNRLGGLVGRSAEMRDIFKIIERSAPTDACILITGESGTGKELVAREIHNLSPRRRGPFVAINCGAVPAAIIESQLFGHERGAFTGAVERLTGLFEQAKGGTLLLDEIGEMPFDLQTRLLRALETKTVRRIGGQEEVAIDARIIAATNRNLKQLVANGKFREDLFFRLYVVPVEIPPLRERRDDVKILANFFLDELAKTGKRFFLTEKAIERLVKHDWPGNARELKNTIERSALFAKRDLIDADDLNIMPLDTPSKKINSLKETERNSISAALHESLGNLSKAARKLGVARTTLQKKIKRLAVKIPHPPAGEDRKNTHRTPEK